jgi:2-oxoisovalerate dehydrogenase E1 component alpha subunit
VHALPILFLCENNQWAISTPISKQMRNPQVVVRAGGYGMRGIRCDGFDPVAVYQAVREARAHAAGGAGPVLVESVCYRFLSHTTDDDDRTYRTRDEVEAERPHDPVPNFEQRLVAEHVLTADELRAMRREVTELVNRTTDEVEAEPYPAPETLYGNTYARDEAPWV